MGTPNENREVPVFIDTNITAHDDNEAQIGDGGFLGRDKHIHGDEVYGDKKLINGDEVRGNKWTIYQQAKAERRATNRQVVRPPGAYVSRGRAQQSLHDLLVAQSGKLNVAGLYGLPGVGKTWLARQVAAELEDEFPDGTLWADLQTTAPADALWSFVEPYEPSLKRSSLRGTHRYLATLQSALADKRVLIVLDQVESAEQVRDLLPAGCHNVAVLIISCTCLPSLVADDNSLYLPEMTPDEAEDLFRTIWKQAGRLQTADSETIGELAHHLQFIPTQMALVAQDILNTQIAPVAYLQDLRIKKGTSVLPGATYDPGFEAVYKNLLDPGKHLLPFVGVLGGGAWQLDALIAVSQLSNRDAEVGLRQLLAAGFVRAESPGRFLISPATRDFALTKLREIGGDALVSVAWAVMAHYYLHISQQAVQHYRRVLLDEFLLDEAQEQRFAQALTEVLFPPVKDARRSVEVTLGRVDPGLAHFELLQDAFEKTVIIDPDYAGFWYDILSTNLSDQKRQLGEALAWALEKEDWPLLRRFAIPGLGDIFVGLAIIGDRDKNRHSWASITSDFGLMRDSRIVNIYLHGISLRATRIVDSTWIDCESISSTWVGVHLCRVDFVNVDLVAATMPGLVVTNSSFVDVDFRSADLRGAVFDSSDFVRVSFRKANLTGAEFVNCSFSETDFRETVFEGVSTGDALFSATVGGRIIPRDVDLDIVGSDALGIPETDTLFEEIYEQIENRAGHLQEGRVRLTKALHSIEQEVTKDYRADTEVISSCLATLAIEAREVFDLTVVKLTHPLAGIAPTIRQAARKARAQIIQA